LIAAATATAARVGRSGCAVLSYAIEDATAGTTTARTTRAARYCAGADIVAATAAARVSDD
jgi:hypothetical protein